MRRETGFIGYALALALFIFLSIIEAAPLLYLSIAIPAWFGTLGFLQAHFAFCATYGLRGLQNASRTTDEPIHVVSDKARSADKHRSLAFFVISLIIALAIAGVALFIRT